MTQIKRLIQFSYVVLFLIVFSFLSYAQMENCNLNGFVTYTQGGWGSPSNSTPGQIRDNYFNSVFPGGLIVGSNYKLTLTSATAVKNFLPQGGTAGAFNQNYTNPSSTSAGVLAGQVVALTLNVYYSAAGYLGTNPLPLGNLVIASGPFAGKTVYQFLAIAHQAIGGVNTGYTFSQINAAATAINKNFNNPNSHNNFLTCPPNNSCSIQNYKTYTQGGWGSPGTSTPGQIRNNYFHLVFPSGLTIGSNFTLKLTSAAAVQNFLPQGGPAGTLGMNYVNPYTTSAGVLAGQLVAATMNVAFHNAGYLGSNPYPIGNLYITSGPFAGFTVNQLLTIANQAIGGVNTGYSLSDINNALTQLNENFDNGTVNNGFLNCSYSTASLGDRVWYDVNQNGIQDPNETGVAGVVVKLYNCSNNFIAQTTTNSQGIYQFTNLAPGSYYVVFVLPNGYQFTSKDQGFDDFKDSDADPVTGKTICINLVAGQNDLKWDAGIYQTPQTNCLISWTGTLGPDSAICLTQPQWITITGSVSLNPSNNVAAYLQTTWRVVHPNPVNNCPPAAGNCNDEHYLTIPITKDTTFTITAWWPGIQPGDQIVEIHYGVNVLDCNGNPVQNGIGRDLYWYPWVCNPVEPDADLSLTKTVNNSNPQNGDIITYTITVTNSGPGNATGVEVTDILPSGVIYQSSNPSQGSYNPSTGIWWVGNLASGNSATLTITAQVNTTLLNSSSFNLGPATGFNVFVLRDLSQPSSDTEGKMAVGRDASLSFYSVGDKLPNSNGTVDVLIVGRNLYFTSGAVYGGNVVYGNYTNLPTYAVSITDGTLRQDNVIDFANAETYLNNLSMTLSNYAANGTVNFQWGGLTLTGTHPYLNVFSVSGAQLSSANNVSISVPNGSVVLVNIDGNFVSWTGGLTVTGTDVSNVLYNFYQADSLKIVGIDVRGSILAPKASVNFISGVQNGQMIAKNLYGMGQFNNKLFVGNIPSSTSVTNIAEITAVFQNDPDSDPNNGNPNEDDYATATFTVNNGNGGGSGGGGNGGNGNWQLFNSQPFNHIVLSITNDLNGNLIVGTVGGNILRTTDNGSTWNQINNSMTVGFIWSLVVKNNKIFAATEQGVFVSNDNGATWTMTSLSGKDVRALAKSNDGSLYAGTWGFGVYKSMDNGLTWSAVNNGLTNLAVHALTVDSYGSVYAGTFGEGIFKSLNGGSSWTKLNVGYNFIWSLAITSTNRIVAGTYGSGVIYSTDLGQTWIQNNNNLPSTYIYSISVDANDNVYVSTWGGGVFVLANNAPGWSPMGLSGFGVSSLFVTSSSSLVYAGTSNGYIYVTEGYSGVTNVNDNTIPTEFELFQNYPNPFNPTTTIKFNLPVAEKVTLKIYNTLGEEVRTLIDEFVEAGSHKIVFDATGLSSGIYIYRIQTQTHTISKKLVLLK
ncbi:MAG: choice-of-anchor A family protein [Ignavibacterium sp.]|nr:choice-of-anchor A family protein [Ignavibacterium sp.]MDW8375801.1 choice-of-anchor A family protein [Ignavibacteriales bacterium]